MNDFESQSTDALTARLCDGWSSEHRHFGPDEFLRLLSRQLDCEWAQLRYGDDFAVCHFPLDNVHLRNFGDLWMVLLGGRSITSTQLAEVKASVASPERQVVVLPIASEVWRTAERSFPAKQEFLVLSPDQVRALLANSSGLHYLIQVARERLSLYHLNPFGTFTVPGSNMFVGRDHELQQLIHMQGESFAIAGPGRIGKSSLLQHFFLWLRRNDPARRSRAVLIDFYGCDTKSESLICRHLTSSINNTKNAYDTVPSNLEKFLRAEARDRGGALELLLDEVDEVAGSETFNKLSEAAKNKICRIILCGKHQLFESMHAENHVFRNRLSLVSLQPLRPAEARSLFVGPLEDLGFEVANEEKIVAQILADTGGYPHLIQYYGKRLVDAALSRRISRLDFELFQEVQNAYETLQTFIGPILDIKNPEEEIVALSILRNFKTTFSAHDVKLLAKRIHLSLDEKGAARICRRLYINNVLAWSPAASAYQVANQALTRAGVKLGFLDRRLAELDKHFAKRSAVGM